MEASRAFALRGILRFKNALLIRKREELGLSQTELSRRLGINYVQYNRIENLRQYPSAVVRRKLVDFCGVNEEELFPQQLADVDGEPIVRDMAVAPEQLVGLRAAQQLPAPDDSPLDIAGRADTRRLVRSALGNLGPRDRLVVELRNGIGQDREYTLDELAERFGVTRERIRQIEQRAYLRLAAGQDGEALRDEHYS